MKNNATLKYFLHSLKVALKPMLFIFIVGLLTYPLVVTVMQFDEYSSNQVGLSVTFLAFLVFIVPICKNAYLKKKKTIDYYYSLPIKRVTLMNINLIVGLIEVLVPFVITYFLGMLITMAKTDMFNYHYYIPLFFTLVGLAISLYVCNFFLATRGNSVVDSILIIALYSCSLWLLFGFIESVFEYTPNVSSEQLITFVPFINVGNYYSRLISDKDGNYGSIGMVLYPHYYLCIIELLTYIPLFILTKKDKSERAEQISNSYLGYRSLIPYYLFTLISCIVIGNRGAFTIIGNWFISVLMITAAGLVGYVIYYRKFKIPKRGWLALIISVVSGILFGIIVALIQGKNDPDIYTYSIIQNFVRVLIG